MQSVSGLLRKMVTRHGADNSVLYSLSLDGETVVDLNQLVGHEVTIRYGGKKNCVFCGRNIRGKTYNDGYCYPCVTSLPQTDMCIVRPHLCHFAEGTCRDEEWGKQNCFADHMLYLARSSSIKVGITRKTQVPTRWMDQGAVEAVVIGCFPDRKTVGEAETIISEHLSDKTNWRKMLKNEVTDLSFDECIQKAQDVLPPEFSQYLLRDFQVLSFKFPVEEYPAKITSLKLDKVPEITEVLKGIKGQYLIFENKVLNLRAHSGYQIEFSY